MFRLYYKDPGLLWKLLLFYIKWDEAGCARNCPASCRRQNLLHSFRQAGYMSPSWMNNLILKVYFKAAHQVVSLPTAASQPSRQSKDRAKWFSPNVRQNCVRLITLCWSTIIPASSHSFPLSFPASVQGDCSERVVILMKGKAQIEGKATHLEDDATSIWQKAASWLLKINCTLCRSNLIFFWYRHWRRGYFLTLQQTLKDWTRHNLEFCNSRKNVFFFQTQHNPQWKPDGSAIGQHWQRSKRAKKTAEWWWSLWDSLNRKFCRKE